MPMLAQTRVAGRCKMEDGSTRDLDFSCAYIMLFERQGEHWVRMGDVSIFK